MDHWYGYMLNKIHLTILFVQTFIYVSLYTLKANRKHFSLKHIKVDQPAILRIENVNNFNIFMKASFEFFIKILLNLKQNELYLHKNDQNKKEGNNVKTTLDSTHNRRKSSCNKPMATLS